MRKKPDPTWVDGDNPEWTETDFAGACPAGEVLPELFGQKQAASMFKPKGGRPLTIIRKEQVAIRLDPSVLQAFRAPGNGCQTRINLILKNGLESHLLNELTI